MGIDLVLVDDDVALDTEVCIGMYAQAYTYHLGVYRASNLTSYLSINTSVNQSISQGVSL